MVATDDLKIEGFNKPENSQSVISNSISNFDSIWLEIAKIIKALRDSILYFSEESTTAGRALYFRLLANGNLTTTISYFEKSVILAILWIIPNAT